MDTISILRKEAAAARDREIKAARAEFRQVMGMIDQLARRMAHGTIAIIPPRTTERYKVGDAPRKRRRRAEQTVLELMADLIPKDRPFSIRDLMHLLKRAKPGRSFNEPTVRAMLPRLAEQGVIRKFRKANKGFVLWVAATYAAEESPIAALTLIDAAEVVLRETGPLQPVAIVVSLQERGYRTDANPRILLASLSQTIKRNRDRFLIRADGKWATV